MSASRGQRMMRHIVHRGRQLSAVSCIRPPNSSTRQIRSRTVHRERHAIYFQSWAAAYMPCITRCCGVKHTATGLHGCSNNIIYQISFQRDRCCLYCTMLRYLWVAIDSTNCCLPFSLQVVAHHSHQPATPHLNPCPHFDREGWMNFCSVGQHHQSQKLSSFTWCINHCCT